MSTAASVPLDAMAAVRALDREFVRLANAGDTAAMVDSFYAEDATLLPPGAPPVQGKAAIKEFWAGFVASVKPSDLELNTTQVDASGDLAYGIGAYAFSAGGVRHTGKYLVALRRQPDGLLRCVADSFGPNA